MTVGCQSVDLWCNPPGCVQRNPRDNCTMWRFPKMKVPQIIMSPLLIMMKCCKQPEGLAEVPPNAWDSTHCDKLPRSISASLGALFLDWVYYDLLWYVYIYICIIYIYIHTYIYISIIIIKNNNYIYIYMYACIHILYNNKPIYLCFALQHLLLLGETLLKSLLTSFFRWGLRLLVGGLHPFCLAPLTHAAGYGAIINFVAKSGETLAAEGWIDRMQAAGVRADIASYNMDAGPEIACAWQVAGCIQRTTLSCWSIPVIFRVLISWYIYIYTYYIYIYIHTYYIYIHISISISNISIMCIMLKHP